MGHASPIVSFNQDVWCAQAKGHELGRVPQERRHSHGMPGMCSNAGRGESAHHQQQMGRGQAELPGWE